MGPKNSKHHPGIDRHAIQKTELPLAVIVEEYNDAEQNFEEYIA